MTTSAFYKFAYILLTLILGNVNCLYVLHFKQINKYFISLYILTPVYGTFGSFWVIVSLHVYQFFKEITAC